MSREPHVSTGASVPPRAAEPVESLGTIQTEWSRVLAHTLKDAGVRLVVASPGSRSTPILAAVLSAGIEVIAGVEADAEDAGSGVVGSRRGVDGAGGGKEPLVADGDEEQPPTPAVVAVAHDGAEDRIGGGD